jgi:hypothetical protein
MRDIAFLSVAAMTHGARNRQPSLASSLRLRDRVSKSHALQGSARAEGIGLVTLEVPGSSPGGGNAVAQLDRAPACAATR